MASHALYKPLVALAVLASAMVMAAARTNRVLLASAADWDLATPLEGLKLDNITGVWVGYGDQYSAQIWKSYFNESYWPDCSKPGAHGIFTYKHWNSRFPDTMAIALPTGASKGNVVHGHEDGVYTWANVTWEAGKYLRYAPSWDGKPTCARVSFYLDNRSGMVMSRIVAKTQLKRVNGTVVYNDVPCEQILDTDVAGCYTKGPNEVHAVAVTSHTCVAGTCLKLSPAFLEQAHD